VLILKTLNILILSYLQSYEHTLISLTAPDVLCPSVCVCGAHYTTIEYDDAIKLGLDKIKGESEPMATEDGETDNIRMRDISMLIPTNDGREHWKIFPIMLRRQYPTKDKKGQILNMPNLLGIDFLRRFRISFDDAHAYLERPAESDADTQISAKSDSDIL
jgi:hypothetical protein